MCPFYARQFSRCGVEKANKGDLNVTDLHARYWQEAGCDKESLWGRKPPLFSFLQTAGAEAETQGHLHRTTTQAKMENVLWRPGEISTMAETTAERVNQRDLSGRWRRKAVIPFNRKILPIWFCLWIAYKNILISIRHVGKNTDGKMINNKNKSEVNVYNKILGK